MTPALQEKLLAKYPKIFTNSRGYPSGIGDGWFNIVYSLCGRIQSYIDGSVETYEWNQKRKLEGNSFTETTPVSQVVAIQIKEKFSSLRFYADGGDDFTEGLISFAQAMSARTCDVCGNPGNTGGKGWITTRCNKHRDTHYYRNPLTPEEQSEIIANLLILEELGREENATSI